MWRNNYNLAIKHWSDKCADDDDDDVQVEILECKRAKLNNYMGMREVGGLFTDGLCTGAVIGKLL